MKTADAWHSVDQIARHLGVSADTVYRWVGTHSMPAHRVGRLWKFQIPEVDAWIRSGGAAEKPVKKGDQN